MLTPKWIDKIIVVAIHTRQIEKFGGTPGLRDEGLLDSALAQTQATFAGELLQSTILEQAAAYLYHLAMNHLFVDGNKPTAFAVMDVFLRVNGYRLTIADDAAYNLVLQVVRGELDKGGLIEKFGEFANQV